jgi:hypothetical protein
MSGVLFRKQWAVTITLLGLIFSDIILGLIYHTAMFGLWTLFTYSGFALIAFFAPSFSLPRSRGSARVGGFNIWVYLALSTLAYWVWTNFGIWLTTPWYPHTTEGLSLCFTAALPFLRNALIGNILYMLLFLACQKTNWISEKLPALQRL